METWFADCNRHTKGVPPEKLQGLLAWAQAERPDVALFIASGLLSNPAKNYLHQYELNNRPPFRIKYWERPTLERLATAHEDLKRRYLLGIPRSESEIVEAEQEFFDRVWYVRSVVRSTEEIADLPEDIREDLLAARKRIEEQYGLAELHTQKARAGGPRASA